MPDASAPRGKGPRGLKKWVSSQRRSSPAGGGGQQGATGALSRMAGGVPPAGPHGPFSPFCFSRGFGGCCCDPFCRGPRQSPGSLCALVALIGHRVRASHPPPPGRPFGEVINPLKPQGHVSHLRLRAFMLVHSPRRAPGRGRCRLVVFRLLRCAVSPAPSIRPLSAMHTQQAGEARLVCWGDARLPSGSCFYLSVGG